jgi:hypothetical protein
MESEMTDTMTAEDMVAHCGRALSEAHRAASDLDSVIRVEKVQACDAIDLRFKDQRSKLHAVVSAAYAAERDAMDRLSDHPWTGKRVYKDIDVGRWGRMQIVRTEGVVETRRSTTVFPVNQANWRIPAIGKGFVRLLKKDGTAGSKIDELGPRWKLIEEEAK